MLHFSIRFYLCGKKEEPACINISQAKVSRRSYAKFSDWVEVAMENMMISIVKVLGFIFPSMHF